MYSTNADINETCFAQLCQCKYIIHVQCICTSLNLFKTKRRLFYLKTQFVPRSKHFLSRL